EPRADEDSQIFTSVNCYINQPLGMSKSLRHTFVIFVFLINCFLKYDSYQILWEKMRLKLQFHLKCLTCLTIQWRMIFHPGVHTFIIIMMHKYLEVISTAFADKFTVLSFLEALEDSVAKSSEAAGSNSAQDESKDSQSRRCRGGDAMDES
ncbi:hypothetical protein BHM03_00009183, partial [Ensete ventricosum]